MYRWLIIICLCFIAGPSFAASQTGKISYYWKGSKTASGERFDKHAMTCAHPRLPFGTLVTVRGVTCRVTDRGPFIKGRILDVSLGVAKRIGMLGAGVVHATIHW